MMPINEQRRRKLQAAFDFANEAYKRDKEDALRVISCLIADHGAIHRPRWDAHRLSCAGVTSTCTWGDTGLLNNWLKAAGVRLMALGAIR